MAANIHPPAQRRKKEPRVGIFWVLNGEPLIDSALLSDAEPYGDHLTHPRGHAAVWERFQQNATAPREMEYEEAPRGRVMYNTKSRRFTLLAVKCILDVSPACTAGAKTCCSSRR